MEDSASLSRSVADTTAASWQAPKSRADRATEAIALAHVRDGKHDQALKILMVLYGTPLISFVLRIVKDAELAKDIRQIVFLEAFQGIDRFEGRSTLWSWLCGIAYHRSLDEVRKRRRSGPTDDLGMIDNLVDPSAPAMTADRVALQRALDRCLGKVDDKLRTQILMRFYSGLSYVEIEEAIGESASTIQVRLSRALPKLRQCLRSKGVER